MPDAWPLIRQPRWLSAVAVPTFMALGQLFKHVPLLIHGAAAGLPGQNSAEGQVVMNGLPSAQSQLAVSCPAWRTSRSRRWARVSHCAALFVTSG